MDRLEAVLQGNAVVWGTPERAALLANRLGVNQVDDLDTLPKDIKNLIVVGGGERMDAAKVWRHSERSGLRLIIIPSLWGSGAEASPVAVLNRDGIKEIHVGEEFLPDVRCVYPELMDSVPKKTAIYGCGDAWAHALEGFLSPLADDVLRTRLAAIISEMLTLPLDKDVRWFELSAQATMGLASSGVGLVHGIAHTLEGPLRFSQPDAGWGHARLCALFLYPVMKFNQQASGKFDELFAQYALNAQAILERIKPLYSDTEYAEVLPLLQEKWNSVLRDSCSRTNSALVRPQSLSFFSEREFA